MKLKKLVGIYLFLAGVIGLFTGGLTSPVLAVVFFPVALLNMFVGSLGFGAGLVVSYAGSVIAVLLGFLLII